VRVRSNAWVGFGSHFAISLARKLVWCHQVAAIDNCVFVVVVDVVMCLGAPVSDNLWFSLVGGRLLASAIDHVPLATGAVSVQLWNEYRLTDCCSGREP